MMTDYNTAREAGKKTTQVLDIGKDVLKRGTRADLREKLETGR